MDHFRVDSRQKNKKIKQNTQQQSTVNTLAPTMTMDVNLQPQHGYVELQQGRLVHCCCCIKVCAPPLSPPASIKKFEFVVVCATTNCTDHPNVNSTTTVIMAPATSTSPADISNSCTLESFLAYILQQSPNCNMSLVCSLPQGLHPL